MELHNLFSVNVKVRLVAMVALTASTIPLISSAEAAGIPIKVVIVTTFELGKDTGDEPGEFQHFAEHLPFDRSISIPGIEHPVRYTKDGVLGIVTGMRGRPRGSLAALITSEKFDLSHAYWIVTGTAGVDPRSGSIGSAAWAQYVVDGDPVFELDDREIPPGWPYGIYALGTNKPNVLPSGPAGNIGILQGSSSMVWRLNPGLVSWAFNFTKDISLADNQDLARARARFPSEPKAQQLPHVMLGDDLGTVRFWHGKGRTQWARDWTKLWTHDAGTFVMSECEDQGILDTLTMYGEQHQVDSSRILVLRAGSNFTQEADGADQILHSSGPGGIGAALEASYAVVSPVVRELVKGWARYANAVPQGNSSPNQADQGRTN